MANEIISEGRVQAMRRIAASSVACDDVATLDAQSVMELCDSWLQMYEALRWKPVSEQLPATPELVRDTRTFAVRMANKGYGIAEWVKPGECLREERRRRDATDQSVNFRQE